MADWQQTRLGEISQIYSGFAFRSQDLGEHGIPVVKIANIQNKRVSPECADHLPEELCTEKLNRYFLQQGDTLIAMTGAGSVGKVGKMPRVDGRFLVNQRVAIVRPDNSRCDPAFVYFGLSQDFYETKLYGLGLGAGQPNVSAKQIGELEIPFPPLPVQRRIAGILSAYDELMENSQRRIRILEVMARALYREWFVHFCFPGHEKLPRVASPLGDIPQGWEVRTVEELVKRIPVGKKYDEKTVNVTGDVPVLDQGKSGIIGYHDDGPGVAASESSPVVVFANHTCYQRLIHFPFSAIQNVLPFVPSPSLPRNIYWLHWATNGLVVFNDYKGHWPEFATKNLVVPPADVCQRFGDFVAPLSRQILKLERVIENLRRTRDLLLPKLISGEMDVSELDIETQEENV
jgi:type I restriction enzyme S subunit